MVVERFRIRWGTLISWRRGIAAAVLAPAAVTLLAIPRDHPPTAIVALLYVLAVVVAARLGGAIPGAAASVLSFLSLNFFFTSPLHTLAVGAPQLLVVLFVFLIAAGVVGLLLSSAVDAKSKAERRESEARLVNRLATGLLSGESTEHVLSGFAEGIREVFAFDRCEIVTSFTSAPLAAGPPITGSPFVVHARAHGQQIGQIRVWTRDRRGPGSAERSIIEFLATQLALALEGARLSAEVRRAELEAQSSQLKAALFSGVTHDVKTPLAAIMASVTSLIDGRGFSDQERGEHLDTIRHEVERLHRVVNNLLDISRLRAGALTPSKKPSPVDELIEGVINRLRRLLDSRPIDLRISDDVPEVPMDVVQIDQVLTNLLENAVKFTPAGSPISLSVVGSRKAVRVRVSDRGPGIREEDRGRIFEPFERGELSGTGAGLGLTISNAIVVAHGGSMWASANPAGGAAFTFELPCTPEKPSKEVSDARTSARG
jgi:two-component system, OmpR family, sensor histidine kinase KdpD